MQESKPKKIVSYLNSFQKNKPTPQAARTLKKKMNKEDKKEEFSVKASDILLLSYIYSNFSFRNLFFGKDLKIQKITENYCSVSFELYNSNFFKI